MATYTYPTNLYQGWDPASAQADFNATGGKNKAGYVAPSGNNSIGNVTSQPSSGYSAPNYQDVTKTAQQIRDFNIQANQPTVQALQGIQGSLTQRYSDLLDSIKGAGSVALNSATSQASYGLGARGILPQSELGQREITNAQLPATAQTQSSLAGAGLQEGQNLASIASSIGALQSGDPSAALGAAQALVNANNLTIPYGGALYNTNTGSVTSTMNSFSPTLSSGGVTSAPTTNTTGNSAGLSSQRTPLTNLSSQFGLGGATSGGYAPNTSSNSAPATSSNQSSNPLSWLFGTTPSLLSNLFK